MKDLLDKFVDPILHLIDKGLSTDQYFKEHEEDIEVLLRNMINMVTWGPNVIIRLEGSKEIDRYKAIYDLAWSWSTVDTLFVLDVLSEIDFTGSHNYYFAERLQNIKPVFITSAVPNGVDTYISEALSAYLWGLDKAAIFLIWAAVEIILLDLAFQTDRNFTLKFYDANTKATSKEAIDSLVGSGMLPKNLKQKVNKVRLARNDIAHAKASMGTIAPTIDLINDSIDVIEGLYGP